MKKTSQFDKAKEISAPVPIKEIPKEVAEKSQKAEGFWADVIVDFDGAVDVFLLNKKDPDYEYRYLNSDAKNLAIKTSNLLYDRGGWRLCPREHLLKIGIKENMVSSDGFYRVGADTVLAYIPKDLHQKKLHMKEKRNKEPMDSINRLIKSGDKDNKSLRGLGHEDMLGLQTQKQLKIKD